MYNENIVFDRKRFDEVFGFYGAKAKLNPQTHQLRMEHKFEKGKGNYNFKITQQKQTGQYNTERYLTTNDLFVAKSLFVGIYIAPVGNHGAGVLYSYPVKNTAALPTGYVGLDGVAGETLYNGALSLLTGSLVNIKNLPLQSFRKVPETQPIQVLGEEGLESSGIIPQFNLAEVSKNMVERIAFAGTKDHEIGIWFPANSDTDIAAASEGYEAFLTVIADGWLVEGGTNPVYKVSDNPFADLI